MIICDRCNTNEKETTIYEYAINIEQYVLIFPKKYQHKLHLCKRCFITFTKDLREIIQYKETNES